MEPVTPLMAEEEDEPKENLQTLLYFGGANKAVTKEKTPLSGTYKAFSFFSSDPCPKRRRW